MAKKATVKITGVSKARDNALKFIKAQQGNSAILNDIGQTAADQIKMRTRARLEQYKQDDIAESTVIGREILAEANNTNEFSQPKRSNLTFTGQLLNSIKYKVIASAGSVSLFLSDFRTKLKIPTKEQIKKVANTKGKKKRSYYYAIGNLIRKNPQTQKSNSDVNKQLESKNRKFLFLSDKLITLLEAKIKSQLRKQLTLYNRIKRKL
jgi:hypothetical protein